ncbi:diacylglycerol/lipid kinase family protein [Propionibacteriaceae bacterium Y1923]|uniref:diacylglycerol/lipid kinase family protein n=1 Tax=Aestuariimicrobium sp. Y1814 TaxID=3418742 RepID=UPI003C1793BE
MALRRFDGPTMTVVVNPKAGRGRAARVLPKVVAQLVAARPDAHLQVHQATSFDDARLRTIQAVERARPGRPDHDTDSLVVMGGDGMAHLGVNACAGTDVRLGIIPAGTGNDFCRGVGIPLSVPAATRVIAEGRSDRIDVNLATGRLADGAEFRHIGCTVSTGYDAKVNRRANAITLPLGALAYGYVALTELARFDPLQYRISIDGEQWELPAMLVGVSNSAYIGGGMQIAPGADVTDGLLDVTIIHPVSRATLLRLMPTLYTGKFINDPAVEQVRAREVVIDGDDMFAMADGELLGEVPVTVAVRPQHLSIYRKGH